MYTLLAVVVSFCALFTSAFIQPSRTAKVKQIHSVASAAVAQNPGVLDETAPTDLQTKFEYIFGKANRKLTHREILLKSEQILQRDIVIVTVVVDAAPQSCPVKY